MEFWEPASLNWGQNRCVYPARYWSQRLIKQWTRTNVQITDDCETDCEMATSWGSLLFVYILGFFLTCSCDGLDFNSVFTGFIAFLLQLKGQLLQVCHPPLVRRNNIPEFTEKMNVDFIVLFTFPIWHGGKCFILICDNNTWKYKNLLLDKS